MQSQTPAAKTALALLSKNTQEEIRRLLAEDMIYLALVYIHFGVCLAGYLPMWTFCIGAPMYISRWMIGLHETLHLVRLEDTNFLIKLHLLIVTPISLGYKEIRDIHMRHHAYTLTAHDPDLYHIKASFIGGFIKATFSPEISAYHWIREKGIDQQLAMGIGIRFMLFVLFVGSLGWTSLWYFIPVRLVYGACMFSISHFLHHDDGLYGTFPPKFPKVVSGFITFYFGRAALQTLCYHDIHHDYPKIAAFKLPEARLYYTPRPTSLVSRPQAEIPLPQ